jgi:hypothetical protein
VTETHSIRPGQVYESCHPLDGGRRIRVVSEPWGGRVDVETVNGRGARRRSVLTTQLHASATTQDDKPRRTGYRLVTDVPA